MEQELTSINLTSSQQELLVKIHSAATPHLAHQETMSGEKAIDATRIMQDLGLIFVDENEDEASITESGEEIMTAEGLVDDMGELTEVARQLIGDSDTLTNPPPEQEPDPFDETPESWDLLAMTNDLSNLTKS